MSGFNPLDNPGTDPLSHLISTWRARPASATPVRARRCAGTRPLARSRHSTEPGSPASKGTIGTSGYNALTCSQLKGAKYTATFAPVANGEVFLVKTAGDHLAKVVVTLTPGNTAPTLRWQSYAP